MANQFENRTGLKSVTAGEGLNTDPMLLAIVAPRPPTDAEIVIALGDIDHHFGPGDFVGPNDSYDRGLGWDRTFEWAQQDGVREDFEQAVLSLLHGAHCKPIECQHAKGAPFAIVINGRHSVLAARIANLIRVRMKKEPVNVGFRRRIYDEGQAAVAADVANRAYKRDPIAVLEQRLYEIEVAGWDDAAAARHFRVSPATIRGWRHKVNGETKAPSEKAPRPMTSKRLVKLALRFEAAHERHSDEQADKAAQLIRYVLNPTSKPPVWLKAYLKEER